MADRDLSGGRLGEFILRERIAHGGYGDVYRSEQPLLKRHVVVKVLWRTDNDIAQERFLREARLASQLDHPYAAHVYAFGAEDNGRLLWIAMELVHGITLSDWLKTRGPMSLEQFVPFFECVAEVVQAAHDRGIIHRDLKPSNVMVIERGGRLLPKLLDFGIAKRDSGSAVEGVDGPEAWGKAEAPVDASDSHESASTQRTQTGPRPDLQPLTRSHGWIGSRPYMSPEQWTNPATVGPATDIYSLGIFSYEVLTGHLPFHAENTREYYRQHCHATVPPIGDGFLPEIDRILQRALAKTPYSRQGSAMELASELRAVLRAQPQEQLRSLAQLWDDRARSPALLLKNDELMHTAPGVLGDLERAYVAASQRHAIRRVRMRRFLAASAAAIVVGAVWYRGELKVAEQEIRSAKRMADQEVRSAKQLTEATVLQSELEQGRAALLHHEPEAAQHLSEAYRRDHSPTTAFMLARALQPRLAEQARFTSSFGRMWSAAFSPDGKQIVTTDDKNAQIWDAQTQQRLFMLPHGDVVYQAVYSADGTKLFTAGGDGAVRIWDARNGTLSRELRRDTVKPRYVRVALSPDGKLVGAMDFEMAHIWNADTGALVAELRSGSPAGAPSLAFSSDDHWFAVSCGNEVRVFETGRWAQILTLPEPSIYDLAWDPKGPHLLTGSTQGDASIWAIPSGKRIHHLREIGEPVDAVAFSPDGRLVVAASRDGAEQIWDARSGKLQIQGNYLGSKIRSVEFDPTSALVVAAGTSGAVVVVDAAQGMQITVLERPRSVVTVAHFDASSRRVIGASWDGTARIWDATSPYRTWSSPSVSDDCGLVTSLEPDRRFVAIGCKDHPTRVWDTAQNILLAELPSVTTVGGDFASAYPAVSAAGDRAAIARGHTVEVYELPGGRRLHTITHGATVNTVAFASTGRDIVSGAVDGSLLVIRDNGAMVKLPMPADGIDAAGFTADGRVVAADAKRRLRVYDAGGAILMDVETSARVRTLRMSSDGRRMVTVPNFMGKPASPELWDLEQYRFVAQLQGQGQAYSARFVGDQVLTAGGGGVVRLWDGITGQLRRTYRGGSRFLADATLSTNDCMVVAGGSDGLLQFWDTGSGRPLWTLQAHRSHLVGIRVEANEIVTRGFSGDISRWTLPRPEQVIGACDDHDRCAIVSR